MSAIGTKQTCRVALHMSAFGGKADIVVKSVYFWASRGRSLPLASMFVADAQAGSRLSRLRSRLPDERNGHDPRR